MCNQANDDKLMDAVLLELKIKVCVSKAAGTPVLLRDNLARCRHELGSKFTAPSAKFEALASRRRPLNGGDIYPRLVIAWPVTMMHRVEHAHLRFARGVQDLQHVGN